jgi:hypothetical protein
VPESFGVRCRLDQDEIAAFAAPGVALAIVVAALVAAAWASRLVHEPTPLHALVDEVQHVRSSAQLPPRSGYPAPPGPTSSCNPAAPARLDDAFHELQHALDGALGAPVECAHINLDNGDLLQHTTRGLAVRRSGSGRTIFTDGDQHWALAPGGVVHWTGTSVDPPTIR